LTTTHEWNWGAAALAYMQAYMDDASEAETSQMAGYLSLVQVKNILEFLCVKFIPMRFAIFVYAYNKLLIFNYSGMDK
jgi:hypothetical protein